MIFDNIKNCKMYCSVNENFEKAFDFIQKATKENLPVGRYELDGNKVYAMIQEYDAKADNGGNFEAHRNYIDIQYIAEGIEAMGVAEISRGELSVEYDPTYDVLFYALGDKTQKLVLQAGDFAVFYPHDVHKPGLCVEGESPNVKKIVVKVAV